MLLTELNEEKSNGKFVGLKPSPETAAALRKLLDNVPNPINPKEFHTTLIYSKKPITFKSDGELDKPIVALPKGFSIFTTDEGAKCLVLELDSPEIVDRHKYIMRTTGASYDHPVYKPHVTLSYDIGNFDISNLANVKDLPALKFVKEYDSEIDLNWAAKKA